MRQVPCSSLPSSAAMQASESKRGMHSQSMEPSRETSAEPLVFANNPYDSIIEAIYPPLMQSLDPDPRAAGLRGVTTISRTHDGPPHGTHGRKPFRGL